MASNGHTGNVKGKAIADHVTLAPLVVVNLAIDWIPLRELYVNASMDEAKVLPSITTY